MVRIKPPGYYAVLFSTSGKDSLYAHTDAVGHTKALIRYQTEKQ